MTNHNPGLRTSDHTALDPELQHDVMAALNAVVQSTDGGHGFGEGQEGFAEWAAQAARLVPYGDWCDRCASTVNLTETGPMRYPRSATVTLGPTGAAWLEAGYLCHICGYSWTSEWAVNGPWDAE